MRTIVPLTFFRLAAALGVGMFPELRTFHRHFPAIEGDVKSQAIFVKPAGCPNEEYLSPPQHQDRKFGLNF